MTPKKPAPHLMRGVRFSEKRPSGLARGMMLKQNRPARSMLSLMVMETAKHPVLAVPEVFNPAKFQRGNFREGHLADHSPARTNDSAGERTSPDR